VTIVTRLLARSYVDPTFVFAGGANLAGHPSKEPAMTLALTINIILDTVIFAVIVGMLARAVHLSRHEQAAAVPAKRRAASQRVRPTREHAARAGSPVVRWDA
jgi:hypothetical protein